GPQWSFNSGMAKKVEPRKVSMGVYAIAMKEAMCFACAQGLSQVSLEGEIQFSFLDLLMHWKPSENGTCEWKSGQCDD
ncbi:unnamed protein product, partial [Ilex paraguariensis]